VRALFVTPSEVSSGEALTAWHMARALSDAGWRVRFLASHFTASFFRPVPHGEVLELGPEGQENRRAWEAALGSFRPHVVVFADYPLLFFPSGTVPLVDPSWVGALESVDPVLVTLDHLGYAQGQTTVFFGPPHLSFASATTPAVPDRMALMLPCPLHDPRHTQGRRGTPFRYWRSSAPSSSRSREEVRSRYLREDSGLLVLHSTPRWGWDLARQFGLPYYDYLSRILAHYLADLRPSVTVVSVNNGHLLRPVEGPDCRVLNLPPLSPHDYEELLGACDLMISENGVSVSVGKAICGLTPCALFRNGCRLCELVDELDGPLRRIVLAMESEKLGAIFPYDVFPIWRRDDLALLRNGHTALTAGAASVEVFGGESTRSQLHQLLTDEPSREALRSRQRAYASRVASAPSVEEALRAVLHGSSG
jgi:hypothetical protein